MLLCGGKLVLTSKFQSMATAYPTVCTTNLQIPTVICCIHPLILPTSKTISRSLNFLDFDIYVVMTPLFPTNQRKCTISSRSVAILILLSTRLNTVLNRLIDSQHCKRHRRKRTRLENIVAKPDCRGSNARNICTCCRSKSRTQTVL